LTNDPHNLRRCIEAQDPVYANVLAELKVGRKATHWMWFVFPRLAGLGLVPERALMRPGARPLFRLG